ncbi:GFA family protein [Pararoseomonas sp. SCSIO 73927]|uniref:GFA family protein n=1 Tax=Pararoseomonas sp. SCSIO 73927 TaxID=3114537 RepID=UPI0030CCFD93
MSETLRRMNGACHCGAVRFEVTLAKGLDTARRCNCSICRMRGAVVVSAAPDGVRVLSGEEALGTYSFNTGTAKHHFCTRCGIYTHHQRRSTPGQFGVNLACLEGMSPFDLEEVPVLDGVRHPSDNGGVTRMAGVLRFIAEGEGASS